MKRPLGPIGHARGRARGGREDSAGAPAKYEDPTHALSLARPAGPVNRRAGRLGERDDRPEQSERESGTASVVPRGVRLRLGLRLRESGSPLDA